MFRATRLRLFALSSLVFLCGACSLLLDLAPSQQCTSDEDCRRFGGALTCSAGSCISLQDTGDAAMDAPFETKVACVSNAECMDKNLGEPYRCDKVSGDCVSLKLGTEICPFVTPVSELRNDDSLIFGAFLPLGQSSPLSHPVALAYQLALNELKNASGIPGGTGSPRRPVVAVFCNAKPDLAEQGVQHLVNTVKVPAVVALFSQTDTARFFQDYLGPNDVFTLNPQDTTVALKSINANRLLWHLLGTPEDIALAYRPLISRLEAFARSRGVTGNVRVALVTSESATEEAISDFVRNDPNDALVFNGKNPSANGADFISIKVASLEKNPSATFTTEVNQLAEFRPHIVVMLTGDEVGKIVPALETKLMADAGAADLPLVALSTRNARQFELLDYLASPTNEPTNDKLERFFGVQYAAASDPTQYNLLLDRFAEANPGADPVTYRAVENFYDAIYWLAYGFAAAGPGAPLRGPSFAEGVRKLLSGPEVNPGSVNSISKAFTNIAASSTGVTFVGALGPPVFDTASGAALSVGALYCYQNTGGSIGPKYDVLRYSRQTKKLEGDFDCFIGFPQD